MTGKKKKKKSEKPPNSSVDPYPGKQSSFLLIFVVAARGFHTERNARVLTSLQQHPSSNLRVGLTSETLRISFPSTPAQVSSGTFRAPAERGASLAASLASLSQLKGVCLGCTFLEDSFNHPDHCSCFYPKENWLKFYWKQTYLLVPFL